MRSQRCSLVLVPDALSAPDEVEMEREAGNQRPMTSPAAPRKFRSGSADLRRVPTRLESSVFFCAIRDREIGAAVDEGLSPDVFPNGPPSESRLSAGSPVRPPIRNGSAKRSMR